MILVDASVWIDYFRNESTPHTAQLDRWLDTPVEVIGTADLVIFEVMRGFRHDRARMEAQALLLDLPVVEIGGVDNALRAAEHDRALRAKGYTIRSPIDVLLASYCITHGHMLLHRDADFDIMKTLRGLKAWPH
ncbi:MAG: PIN domain nuclease [Burkholderiales bacterium]|nr:PIN domain nuclease [Burkholderiales bacterium]